MALLAQVQDGFRDLPYDPAIKNVALRFLEQWLTAAEFAPYRPQLEWLVDQKQWLGLLDRFYQIMPFGTGGRRGPVGIGPNRMNLWTLGASVQGHCEYLKQRFPGVALRVALAYDVRRFLDQRKNYNPDLPNPVLGLSSREFAQHAATIYAANGIEAFLLPPDSTRYLATPELSFTIRHLKAHGGLNVSASHNPPDDNGGKFYDERGGQPVPPEDQLMADLVDQVTTIRSLPWADAVRSGKVKFLDDAPHRAYIELIRRQSLVPPPRFDEIEVVFTPLNGVGAMNAMEALVEQGFRVRPVAEQMQPDGQFSAVTKSPNPEVPESMDRAEALAKSLHADLVLATDPDADRIGGMVPDPADPTRQTWRFLTGNELAVLAFHFKLAKLAETGQMPRSPIVIRTEVTTSLLTRIARHFKAQIVDNLMVGFKYIAEVLWQLESQGCYEDVTGSPDDFVIGGEESHGLLVTHHLRDKDSAGAALLLAEMALDLKRRGLSVLGYLDSLHEQFGYFRNEVVNLVMTGIEGKTQMVRMLDDLRAHPPKSLGGLDVTGFEDLRDPNGRFGPIKGATDAASRNFLIFRLGEQAKVALRPSGTEPKAKAYVEASSPPRPVGASAETWKRTRTEVDERIRRLAEDFVADALRRVGMPPPREGIQLSR